MGKAPKVDLVFRKPLLAEDVEDINALRFPLWGAMKKDGFRGINRDGKGVTRRFKPIANNFTRKWIEENIPPGMEGELTIAGKDFNACQSAFTTVDGEPDFIFNAFDWFDPHLPYCERYAKLKQFEASKKDVSRFKVIECVLISSPEELIAFEEANSKIPGLDGTILREINGRYKCGRSTLKEQLLLRIKRWADSEAEIIEVYEQMSNQNEATTGALGQTERSTHKEGMVPAGTFGGFVIRDLKTGKQFDCGGGEGLTKELRQRWWDDRKNLIGKVITYKYMKAGMKDKPRFPQWKGFRDVADFGE